MNILSTQELIYIFSELDIPSAGRAAIVCKHWKTILVEDNTQEEIWQNISNRLFGGDRQNAKTPWRYAVRAFINNYKKTPEKRRVIFALQGGHVTLLMELWTKDSDLAALKKANIGQLISRAASSKSPKVIKWLFSTGALQSHPWQIVQTASQKGNVELMETVFSYVPDMVSNLNTEGLSVLLAAIQAGETKAVEYLIDKGARIDIPIERSLPALHVAAKNFQLEILQLMQKKFPDIFLELANKVEGTGNACLIGQTKNPPLIDKYFATFKWLVENGVNGMGTNAGMPAIHHAAMWEGMEFMEYLLELGENVNRTTDTGATPLHYAKTEEVIQYLVDRGANINATDYEGCTALNYHFRSPKIVQFLLSIGADPFADTNPNHFLIRMYESASENYDVLFDVTKQLISRGVSINVGDEAGHNMLHFASRIPIYISEWLVENGIDVNKADEREAVPFIFVGVHKDNALELIELLHRKGADINKKTDIGANAIFHAILSGNCAAVQKLLEIGVSIDTIQHTMTPLHIACMSGFADIAEVLIKYGADIHAKTPTGETPYAVSTNRKDFKTTFWPKYLDSVSK